jgi:hypothetical protein
MAQSERDEKGRFVARASKTRPRRRPRTVAKGSKLVRTNKRVQVQREREGTWTAKTRDAFCHSLSETLNVRASLRKVGMSASGFYKLKRRDPEFEARCDEALAGIYFEAELAMARRSRDGERKAVFQGGKRVGTIRHYPDRVMLTLLRAHRERAERGAGAERFRAQEEELARLRLEAKLSEMNRRMGGNG